MIRPTAVPVAAGPARAVPARTVAIAAAAACLLVAPPGTARVRAGEPPPSAALDVRATTRVIDEIRHALPGAWEATTIRWNTVPRGWRGDSTCVLMELEDMAVSFDHPDGFQYHPFYKIWLLPPGWEGRMEVSAMDIRAPHATYLGENAELRVLARTLGPTTWPEGPEEIGRALGLATYPLSPFPEHRLDVPAMQKLFQRLDATDRGGGLDRWRHQIYGIEELDNLIYVELLTWEDLSAEHDQDPTFLGDLAERETAFLSREALAAFPTKRGLYLRRVTRESFSDVIVVNPSVPGS
jgi:hypothetical protein